MFLIVSNLLIFEIGFGLVSLLKLKKIFLIPIILSRCNLFSSLIFFLAKINTFFTNINCFLNLNDDDLLIFSFNSFI